MSKKRTEIQDADEKFVRVIVGLHKLSQWAKEAGITEKELIREARRQWKLLRKEKREGAKAKGSRRS